jgi:hypothetical protein
MTIGMYINSRLLLFCPGRLGERGDEHLVVLWALRLILSRFVCSGGDGTGGCGDGDREHTYGFGHRTNRRTDLGDQIEKVESSQIVRDRRHWRAVS